MKKFEATSVIHYGSQKEAAMQEFTEKWATVMFDNLKTMTIADLKILNEDVKEQIGILEGACPSG